MLRLVLLALSALVLPLSAAQRVAVVIGCGEYRLTDSKGNRVLALPNPPKDARSVAAALSALGFEVVGGKAPGQPLLDATRDDVFTAMAKLRAAGKNAEVVLFYFAGHGIEDEDEDGASHNFLIPVEATLTDRSQLRSQAVSLEDIMKDLGKTGATGKLAVIDACRNNPLRRTRSWAATREFRDEVLAELGPAQAPDGTALLFASGPGRKTADRLSEDAANSPFTARFIESLRSGGSILTAFGNVEEQVKADTDGRQVPHTQLFGSLGLFQRIRFGKGAVALPTPALRPKTNAEKIAVATKEAPFVNSLGMEFVPVPGTTVLMCRTETRVRDWEEFMAQNPKHDMSGGMYVMKVKENAKGESRADWELDKNASWKSCIPLSGGPFANAPGFKEGNDIAERLNRQAADKPVVGVSVEDAKAFAQWLSKRDSVTYRLPTDKEWSEAEGTDKSPRRDAENLRAKSGNYLHDAVVRELPGSGWLQVHGNSDFTSTAPVGSYKANSLGIYDLDGNVWEWCDDKYRASVTDRKALEKTPVLKNEIANHGTTFFVLRGASWETETLVPTITKTRIYGPPTGRRDLIGFRLVVSVR